MSSETDLVPVAPNALQSFASHAGQRRMIAIANEFSEMVRQREAKRMKKWIVDIGQGKHLTIEAWQYIGQRVGILAQTVPEFTVDIYNPVTGDFEGVRAVTEAIRLDTGEVITRAVQVCYADEVVRKQNGDIVKRWLDEEGKPNRHAITGMAQTRSASRCLANALRFIAEMAGMDGTPAEEMDGVDRGETRKEVQQPKAKTNGNGDDAKVHELVGVVKEVESTKGNTNGRDWLKYGIQIGNAWYSTFEEQHAATAAQARDAKASVKVTYTKSGKYNNLATIAIKEDDDF